MSCGTKIEGRYGSLSERDDIAEALEQRGESRLADDVMRGHCLSSYDLRLAESTLDDAGMDRHFDYRERPCHCAPDEQSQEPDETWGSGD